MFTNNCNFQNDESYFVNPNFRNKIETVFPSTQFSINFRSLEGHTQKSCLIIAEKIDSYSLLQVRASDLNDHAKMFLATIDGNSFEQLKRDQSLHVTFTGFVDNLISLLTGCRNGQLQINLSETDSQYFLQFYEIRTFRNLIHLSLPVKVAPLSIVLYHVSRNLQILENQQIKSESSLQHMQHELLNKDDTIGHLRNEIDSLKSSLAEHENMILCRTNEQITKLTKDFKALSESKEVEGSKLKEMIADLKNRIEELMKSNSSILEEKANETRKINVLNEDICVLKSNTSNLKEQNEKLHAEVASLRNIERKNEMHLNDIRKQLQHSQEIIKKQEKAKSDLIAELEAEKKVCQVKRNALQMATEEIDKANDIIGKQLKELASLRKTVEWRTEVALHQEVIIRDKVQQLTAQKEQFEALQTDFNKSGEEIKMLANQLEVMKQLVEKIETKYSEKITDLLTQISTLEKYCPVPVGLRNIRHINS